MTRRSRALLVGLLACAAIAICACARTPEQKAARFIQRGKTMLEKKDYARAVLEFSSATKIQPKSAEAQYQLGVAYAGEGDYFHAGLSYQKATKLDSRHNAARLKLAELMATSQKQEILEEVDRMANKVLSMDPGNSEALRIRALAEMRLGDLEKAVNSLREAVEKSPQNVQAAVMLAATRLVQRDAAGAEAIMRKLVADVPTAESWSALGRFYRLLGRDAEADQSVRKAAQMDPKNAGALFDLARLQLRLKQTDQAGATLQQLAELPDTRFRGAHAMFLFNTGKRDEAIREFEKLNAKHPEDRITRTRLVMAYLAARRAPEAEKTLANTLKRNPKDTDALLLRAQMRLASGQMDEAALDLAQVLALNPNSAEARYWNSKVLRSRNRLQAEQELGEAVRLAPYWLEARLELARSFREAHHPEMALEYLDKMPNKQKGLLNALIDRNWLLFDLRRDTELQDLLRKELAVRRDPTFLLQQALLDMRRRQFPAARACLEEILSANPEEYRAIDAMLALFLAQDQRAASLDWFQKHVAQRPNSAVLRHMLGQWQADSGDVKGARASYRQAIALDPKYKPAELELAKLDLASGNLGPARQVLESLLKSDPRDAPARMVLASLEEKAGNFAAAGEHYELVLAADPNHAVAHNNLASLLVAHTGNIEAALAHATKAYELAPGSPEINDTLGWIYYKMQVYQSAVPYLETAVKLLPNAIHKTHLGLSYHELGRDHLAVKTIAEALALQPDLAEAQAARLKVLTTR